MNTIDIDPEILKRLQDQASQANCSVDALLNRLLGSPLQIDDDKAEEFPLVFDVRRQAEEALKQSEERYRLLAQNVTDMISRHTLDGVYTYATPSAQTLLGYAPEELIGHSAYEFFHPDDLKAIQQSHQTILEQPLIYTVEYRIRRKDGAYIWFETTSRTMKDAVTGKPLEIISVSRDISERKQIEEALKQSEARYRLVSELVSDYAYSYQVDADGQSTLEWITDAYKHVTGYTPYVIDDPGPYMLYHPDDRAQVRQDVERVLRGAEVTSECRIYTKSGELRWLRVYRCPVWDEQAGRVIRFYAVVQDITKEKQAEEALRQSEERYRVISELVSDYAYCCQVDEDGQTTLEWLTNVATEITGYSPSDPAPAYAIFHPDDKEQARQDVERVIQGEEVTSEYRIVTKNGELRWLRIVRRPVWDEQAGRVVRFYAVVQDITLEKHAEQIRLEQERLKANLKKEKEFNTLILKAVSALSHDVRTPLAVIATAKDILDRYFDRLDEKQRCERLDSIGKQLRYVIELLDDVTTTVKGNLDYGVFKPEAVNFAALCEVSINEIQETAGSKHRLRFVTDEQITTAIVDETLVNRILLNLLSNAVKFSPETSEIRLELSRRADWIVLRVVDQGMGISQEEQQHVFEPFYRADSASEISGTGLGLSIVQDCVNRHHGRISVESAAGQGTTFIVELPFVAG